MRAQYFIANGRRIAVVAATRAEKNIHTPGAGENTPGVLRTYEPELFLQAIAQAKQKSDYVAAFVHWGTENSTVLETAQLEQGKQYIDAGADLVVGAHPHCLQGFGYYAGKPIAYSLGNFWFNTDTVDTGVLMVELSAQGKAEVHFIPCIQHGGRVELAEPGDAQRILAQLNDISQGAEFDPDGMCMPAHA